MAKNSESGGITTDVDLIPIGIASITYVGEEEVYDLETETHHTFIADGLAVHNCQDFDSDLEHVVFQVQSASDMPITVFAGTSLTTDTFLEQKWSESSGGIWVMKCRACNHDNIPLPEFGVMDMIQPLGISCVKCNRLLDVPKGIFVHGNSRLLDAGKIGFHIPQLIVPAVYNNPTRWAKIYEDKHKDYRKFLQENLGVATEEGERELTRTHLQEICSLGKPAAVQLKAMNREYQYVVSGCDWGGSDYNPNMHTKVSTTVHAMAGIRPDGKFEICHLRRYGGMNYDEISADIIMNHNNMNGTAIASDYGVGAAYNSRLREKLPQEKHLIFNYVGPDKALISEPAQHHMFNMWSLNKTESISLTFDAIRKGRILCYDWQYSSEFLLDCLNVYRAPGEKTGETGASTFLYKAHPSKPNDTLQAINYLHMLGKILLGEPMFADITVKVAVESSLRGTAQLIKGLHRMGRPFAG